MTTVPSLIGHILYGVGLALVFFALQACYNPWWLPPNVRWKPSAANAAANSFLPPPQPSGS